MRGEMDLASFGFLKWRPRVINGIPILSKYNRKGGASNTNMGPIVTDHISKAEWMWMQLENIDKFALGRDGWL
jgi:hypothetical protein